VRDTSDIEIPSRTGISCEVTASETGGANMKEFSIICASDAERNDILSKQELRTRN